MESDTILLKLRELTTSVDASQIDKLLAEAQELKLIETEEFQSLLQHSAKLTSQIALKDAMVSAIEKEDLEQLKRCMEQVKQLGLATNPESWLPGLDGVFLASQVFDTMERVKAKMKADGLRQKEQVAVQAALFTKKSAMGFETKVPDETKKENENAKLEEDKVDCLSKLQDAAAEYDAIALKELMRQGYQHGISKEELGYFHAQYSNLKNEDFLQEQMAQCEEALRSEKFEEIVIKQLRNLSRQLCRITGDELFVEDTEDLLRKHSKQKRLSAITEIDDSDEEEEVELPLGFFHLANFPKLKKNFRGHRGSLFARMSGHTGRGDMQKMVSHSYGELKEGLTELPTDQEQQAIVMFRDILRWMGDVPGVRSRFLSDSHAIVAIAKTRDPLKDEVYCQVMKQLNSNPSQRSILFGWKLLLLLCQEIAPSEELYKFVRCFIIENLREFRSIGGELLLVARQCLSDANKHSYVIKNDTPEETDAVVQDELVAESTLKEDGPCAIVADDNTLVKGDRAMEDGTVLGDSIAKEKACTMNDDNMRARKKAEEPPKEATDAEHDIVDVVVFLMDHSTRKIQIRESSTLLSLAEKLAMRMRLERWQDFSFFQLIVGSSDMSDVQRCTGDGIKSEISEAYRLLPMKSVIKTLLKKWESLKRITGKDSFLLLKRCFVNKEEELRSHDVAHATLTYRQLMWDYLHYPVYESKVLLVQAAAAVLCAERDDFLHILKSGDLSGKGVLEQVIPDHVLKYDTDRSKWSKAILQKLSDLDAADDSSETRQTKMSRFVEICQGMKMFGSQYWHVEQCAAPDGEGAVQMLPVASLMINPKEPLGEYWIVVNTSGVSFVPFDGAPGEEVLRSFEFSSRARDQLVRWGHRGDLLQFVVKTADSANLSVGQVDLSISFRSSHALDCAFAVQVAKGMRRDQE